MTKNNAYQKPVDDLFSEFSNAGKYIQTKQIEDNDHNTLNYPSSFEVAQLFQMFQKFSFQSPLRFFIKV